MKITRRENIVIISDENNPKINIICKDLKNAKKAKKFFECYYKQYGIIPERFINHIKKTY
jgi:hypothetical protein